jgi:predicted peptidase
MIVVHILRWKYNGTDFILEKNYNDLTGKVNAKGVTEISICETEEGTEVELILDPFVYRYDFKVTGTIAGTEVSFTRADVDKVWIKDMDQFVAYEENGVHYRMYEPECMGKRPLVLFLHGGGECGEDNELQLTGTLGALRLAERWSDMYIMAPQAPSGNLGMQEMFEVMKKRGNPFSADMGITPFSLKGERGWNRDYVAKVTDIIRKMISDGKVDENRVYLIGMSMGGGGVLQTISVAPDLFAAAVPICPSMNGESYANLLHLPKVPVWITSAYMDHQHSRHAFILNACNKLWQEGRTDVKFTLYTQEELAKYGIGTTEGLTSQELDAENHNSWILALHNENGILDWMISHQKNKEKC